MDALEAKIGMVEQNIAEVEATIASLGADLNPDDVVEQSRLNYLRGKESQLRDEKRQLREEKLLLLQQAQAGSKRSADETVEQLRFKEELARVKEQLAVLKLAASPQAACETVERFKAAVYAVKAAPHSQAALLDLCRGREAFIPVCQTYLDEVAAWPENRYLRLGHGTLAEHMSTLLRDLARTTEGSTECPTTVEVTGRLFRVLFRCLDQCFGLDALGATVLQNESVSKASSKLQSAVEANKRPDHVILSKRKQTLGVVEDKQPKDMLSAEEDMCDYLQGGLFAPAYQGMPGILLVAAAGVDIKLGVCGINGQVSLMLNAFSVNSVGGAILAVVAACTYYSIFLHLQDLSPKEINVAAFGVPIVRGEGATIQLNSLKHGIHKTIKDFAGFCSKFGVTLQSLQDAYAVSSPFLPVLKDLREGNPHVTISRRGSQTYHLTMMTYGYKLDMSKLSEEEAARCVYAWLIVASLLHAKSIVASDFRWDNLMKQQPRVPPGTGVANSAYQKLTWIPLVHDLELACIADQEPLQTLRDWGPDTLQGGKYTCSSDVYQIGIMMQQWREASGCSLDAHGVACLDLLLSHTKSAAEIASSSRWLDGARAAFRCVMACPVGAS